MFVGELATAAGQSIQRNPIRSSLGGVALGVTAISLGLLAQIGGIGHVSSVLNWAAVGLGSVATFVGGVSAIYHGIYPTKPSNTQPGSGSSGSSVAAAAAPAVRQPSAATPPSSAGDELVVWDDGREYRGQVLNGKPHGNGRMTWKDGSVYEGDFEEGQLHGRGRSQYANGDVYEGTYANGLRHGHGKYQHKDGRRYEGFYENGKPHGSGVYQYRDGGQYKGTYANGLRHGQGTETRANGDVVYDGEWKEGKRHGLGTFFNNSENKFTGPWLEGHPNGDFIILYSGRACYSGGVNLWLLPNGKGEMTYMDGDRYTGDFVDGKRHGQGTYRFNSDGAEDIGIWENDEFIQSRQA